MAGLLIDSSSLPTLLNVPFGAAEQALEPGFCVQLGTLQIVQGQVARLSWMCLHLIRVVAMYPPTKINPAYAAVYMALYGEQGALIQVIPGTPMAYVGLDTPGVAAMSPSFAPDIGEPDTYTVLLINNMLDAPAVVAASGSWKFLPA